MKTKYFAGMTLIELMVAVAIVGILAAIAYPSYADYIQRARRADVQGELLRLMDQQEIFFNSNLTYTADLTQIGGRAATEYYDVAMAACGAGIHACVTATVTPSDGSSQENDTSCTTMTLSSNGVKTALDGTTDTTTICWQS